MSIPLCKFVRVNVANLETSCSAVAVSDDDDEGGGEEPLGLGVTMQPPGLYYYTEGFKDRIVMDDVNNTIQYIATQAEGSGESYNVNSRWVDELVISDITSVTVTFRSLPTWDNDVITPDFGFRKIEFMEDDVIYTDAPTIEFTEANQELTETFTWLTPLVDNDLSVRFISPGVGLGWEITNIVFDPEPTAIKGITMSPPATHYQNIPTYFVTQDEAPREIIFVETPGSEQGEAFTILLLGDWGVGFGNTPSSVTITLRSPADWVAGNASTPNLFFSWQDGFIIQPLSEDLTMVFTETNQTITETVNWIGGNADIEYISPIADGVGIGFIIENIIFNSEPDI
jgi:hypothetical protein